MDDRTRKIEFFVGNLFGDEHPDLVKSVLFLGPNVIVTSCKDRILRFWNTDTRKLIHTIREDESSAPGLASKSGQQLVGLSSEVFLLFCSFGVIARSTKHPYQTVKTFKNVRNHITKVMKVNYNSFVTFEGCHGCYFHSLDSSAVKNLKIPLTDVENYCATSLEDEKCLYFAGFHVIIDVRPYESNEKKPTIELRCLNYEENRIKRDFGFLEGDLLQMDITIKNGCDVLILCSSDSSHIYRSEPGSERKKYFHTQILLYSTQSESVIWKTETDFSFYNTSICVIGENIICGSHTGYFRIFNFKKLPEKEDNQELEPKLYSKQLESKVKNESTRIGNFNTLNQPVENFVHLDLPSSQWFIRGKVHLAYAQGKQLKTLRIENLFTREDNLEMERRDLQERVSFLLLELLSQENDCFERGKEIMRVKCISQPYFFIMKSFLV